MAIKTYKPTSKGVRFKTSINYGILSKVEPEKSLLAPLHQHAGRNNHGRITVRHQGGGHKRKYRIIDFKRNKDHILATVKTLEYDPNRSAFIALLSYADGEKRYIIAPDALKVGDVLSSGENAEIHVGNALALKDIPVGSTIHNIELKPGKGAQLVRSAGTFAQLLAKEGRYAHVRLPSGEIRLVLSVCRATLGQVSNLDYENVSYGKAGRKRWLGIRPTVRGVAMNPVDHPHGGGEGKTAAGRHPVSPWGKHTKGMKTRDKKKSTSKYIVQKRSK